MEEILPPRSDSRRKSDRCRSAFFHTHTPIFKLPVSNGRLLFSVVHFGLVVEHERSLAVSPSEPETHATAGTIHMLWMPSQKS